MSLSEESRQWSSACRKAWPWLVNDSSQLRAISSIDAIFIPFAPGVVAQALPREALQFDNSSLDCDCDCMSPVAGAQLGKDVSDVNVYRFLSDRQPICHNLVRVTRSN